MLKILQVVPYFYPAWSYGGPAKVVYDTSRYVASQGHQVTVYTSDAYDATTRMPDDLRLSATNELNVRYFRNLSNKAAYSYNVHCAPGLFLTALFELRRFDCIHLHDFYTLGHAWICLLAWIYSIPYTISVHGCLEPQRRQQKSRAKALFLSIIGNAMLQRAAICIATSQDEVVAYQEAGVKKQAIRLIGHGIDTQELVSSHTPQEARQVLGLPPSERIYTYLGRFHQIKGIDLLLSAFATLARTEKMHLVLAGSDDGFEATIRSLIQEYSLENRITLLGPTAGAQKNWLFAASDVFVYPSRSEGFSVGILEAAASGLPLLLTRGCHFPQVATAQAGVIVPTTVKGITHGLQTMQAMSPRALQQMGKKAQQLIERQYSLQAIGNQLLSVYESLGQ